MGRGLDGVMFGEPGRLCAPGRRGGGEAVWKGSKNGCHLLKSVPTAAAAGGGVIRALWQ
jgi:hypothetical protein